LRAIETTALVLGRSGKFVGGIPWWAFTRRGVLPRPTAGNGEDNNHHDERRAEQQQLVKNAAAPWCSGVKTGEYSIA